MAKKDSEDSGDTVVQMTQDSLDGLFATRASRAAVNREKEILDKLGFNTLEEAVEELGTLRTQTSETDETNQATVDDLNSQLKTANDSLTALNAQVRQSALRREIAEHFTEIGFVDGSKEDVYSIFEGDLPEGVTIDEESWKIEGVKEALKGLAEKKPHWIAQTVIVSRTPGRRVQTPAATATEEDTYRINM